jgi:hypothetical protein
MIADSMIRLGNKNDALSYLEMARRVASSPDVRKRVLATIVGIRNELRIQRENSERRPILHEALEQDRIVRPRMVARLSSFADRARMKRESTLEGLTQ